MKGIIFLDKNFKTVPLPRIEACLKEFGVWIDFTSKCRYVFFAIPERMQWFKDVYKDIDDMNSIFGKVTCDVYTYDADDDYWSKETDQAIIHRVFEAYAKNQELERNF